MSTVSELTTRLTNSVDANYDVVDMESVLEIIGQLENQYISKEQLEATRLAKHINHLRRRLKDDGVARRCKNLLKKWREMVGINNAPQSQQQQQQQQQQQLNNNNGKNVMTTIGGGGVMSAENSISTSFTPHVPENVKSMTSTTQSSFMPYDNDTQDGGVNKQSQMNFLNFLKGNRTLNAELNSGVSDRSLSHMPINTRNCSSPVIIDIHDSNSSNLTSLPPNAAFATINNVEPKAPTSKKEKKNKKDKKNKERREVSAPSTGVQSNFLPHMNMAQQQTHSMQQQQYQLPTSTTTTTATMPLNMDERSRYGYMSGETTQPNVSEILSLSTCSMSSNFPPADSISSVNRNANKNLGAELSFAGKFKPMNSPNLSQRPSSSSTSTATIPMPNKGTTSSQIMPGYHYSNESSSSSHISNIGLVDMHDNNNIPRNHKLNLLEQQQQQQLQQLDNSRSQMQPQKTKVTNEPTTTRMMTPIITTSPPPHTTKTTTTGLANSLEVPQKVPKKRGRKKGSKGIDSMISNDTSLSTHLLQLHNSIESSSLGNVKKVKSTKELFAHMQIKKLALEAQENDIQENSNSNTNNINNNKLSPAFVNTLNSAASSCSEISNMSTRTVDATRNTMSIIHEIHSDSETRDSSSIITNNNNNNNTNNSNQTGDCTGALPLKSSVSSHIGDIMETLAALELKFPTWDQDRIRQFLRQHSDCSCDIVIKEIDPDGEDTKANPETIPTDDQQSLDGKTIIQKFDPPQTNLQEVQQQHHRQPMASAHKSTEKLIKPKQQKSIFDFDFDDDDDPLLELKAEVENINRKEEEEDTIKADEMGDIMDVLKSEVDIKQEVDVMPQQEADIPLEQQQQQPPWDFMPPPMPFKINKIQYTVTEDPNCLGRKRMLSKQYVTGFHVKSLHNYFISNVNGNWNGALVPVEQTSKDNNEESEQKNDDEILIEDVAVDEKVVDVVPQYGELVETVLPKCFTDIEFTIDFKPNKKRIVKTIDKYYKRTFLGISKTFLGHIKRPKLEKIEPQPQDDEDDFEEEEEEEEKETLPTVALDNQMEIEENSVGVDAVDNINENIPLKETPDMVEQTTSLNNVDTEKANPENQSEEMPMETYDDNLETSLEVKTVDADEELPISPMMETNNNLDNYEKIANNENEVGDGEDDDLLNMSITDTLKEGDDNAMSPKNRQRSESTSSSSSNNSNSSSNNSNTSLKTTQNSINLRLKQHRLLQQQQQQQQLLLQQQINNNNNNNHGNGDKSELGEIDDVFNEKKRKREYNHENNWADDNDNDDDDDEVKTETVKVIKKIKRIKIAINGKIETQRQISYNDNMSNSNPSSPSSNDDSDDYNGIKSDENDDENEITEDDNDEVGADDTDNVNNNYHELINNPGNHFKITIKKLHRASNSSSPQPYHQQQQPQQQQEEEPLVSPATTLMPPPAAKKLQNKIISEDINQVTSPSASEKKEQRQNRVLSEEALIAEKKKYELFKIRREDIKRRMERRMAKIKRLAAASANNLGRGVRKTKTHRKLFQSHELFPLAYPKDIHGHCHAPLFDHISSCSSDCDTCSGSDEYDSDFNKISPSNANYRKMHLALDKLFKSSGVSKKTTTTTTTDANDNHNNNNDGDDKNVEKVNDVDAEEVANENENSNNDDNDDEDNEDENKTEINVLPEHNNGFLESFNKMYAEYNNLNAAKIVSEHINASDKLIVKSLCSDLTCNVDIKKDANNENHGDGEEINLNANTSVIRKTSSTASASTIPTTIPEFPLAADTKPYDENITGRRVVDDNNPCEYKEWYQVLRIQSYNDELVTVLPYVILD